MKHKRNRPRKGEERTEETLRGRIRELEKEIDRLKRQLGSLQKHPKRVTSQDDPKEEDVESNDKEFCCPNCGSPDYKAATIWSPNGYLNWMVCQSCRHKEKIKSESR